jgi:hypothetical protein
VLDVLLSLSNEYIQRYKDQLGVQDKE